MRRFIYTIIFIFLKSLPLHSQQPYWQQEVNFTIDVSLNDKEHTLDAFERIDYINHSPDTLHFIWFHLWPNAYKNDKTAFTDQTLENGDTRFYFSNREERGYINRLDFKVNNITAQTEDHPHYIDIIKLILPTPLAPGEHTFITTPFHVKLPFNFSRGGHDGETYQVTQWYPKPAVYDRQGWHPIPYLDQGEFYSEFGSFDVYITVPANYVVAATGVLQNENEINWLKSRKNYDWTPLTHKEKLKTGETRTIVQSYPNSDQNTKTLEYKLDRIHDFAWFADKRFIVNTDTCQLPSGRIVNVITYYTPAEKPEWSASIRYAKNALRHYSSLVGEYPYPTVQVVQGPESFGGGMEYPTITVISPIRNARELDKTIAHEIGHNWFYGILASNERDHPWMDEGVNSYYEAKYDSLYYHLSNAWDRVLFETKAATHTDQPINLSSEKFSEANYNLSVYYKTSAWLQYLESRVGAEAFNKAMQAYYQQWQFRHPQPEDFKKSWEESTGQNLDSIFAFTTRTGTLPNLTRNGTNFIFAASPAPFKNGPDLTHKTQIAFSPALGYNSYDNFMIGAFVTNHRLPPNAFTIFLSGLYATGSSRLSGLGSLNYALFPKGWIRRVDIGLNGATFSNDRFIDDEGNKTYLHYTKLVPKLKLTWREKDARSTLHKYLSFKTYLINEQGLQFYRDTTITGIDTTILTKYRVKSDDRTLNQLKFVIENNRALYPYSGEWQVEQGKYFIRAAFTGNYFFNYPKGGGLNVRLFAGKFFYTGSKTSTKQFATDRYHLNMTGANGYEDYTYSDYFIGRNKFSGFESQQIMLRDGAFKVRTDLLADKVGRTDNWLAAANFTTTIPASINPLNLLPVHIPVKLFLDIGTYAETWKQEAATDRFLYDAGFYFPLLKETVNIYVPLLYSSVYKDYYASTIEKKKRFWNKISFTIDIANFSFRKVQRELNLQ